ncbi:hypothetical protein CUMW_122000 [Citrus unshiu]|nr:hypothetical protein CUMW_122000 [Citrus unshiu]
MDIEQGSHHHRRSVAGSEVSVCFSDAEDGGSCYSQFYSTTGGSYDEYSFACVSDDQEMSLGGGDSRRVSSLGCSCKDDLAAAHKQCAEAWFKIRGNKTCEICNSIARNVAGATEIETAELSNEVNNANATSSISAAIGHGETRSIWHGHRFLNFLLACMVFAFVISWLFHFNMPSS